MRTIPSCGIVIAISAMCGCGGSITTNMDKTLYQGDLDPCYEIKLVHKTTKHMEGLKPEDRYEEMDVVIAPRVMDANEYRLNRVDVKGWPSWSQYQFGDVQARTDAQGQRVWFVDTKDGKIVGSIDRQTGETTGPNDPAPTWATVDGGVALGAVAK
jgi:hypothetical protein